MLSSPNDLTLLAVGLCSFQISPLHLLPLHVVVQVPILSLYKQLIRNLLVLYHYTHNPMKLRYRWLAAMTAIESEALTL